MPSPTPREHTVTIAPEPQSIGTLDGTFEGYRRLLVREPGSQAVPSTHGSHPSTFIHMQGTYATPRQRLLETVHDWVAGVHIRSMELDILTREIISVTCVVSVEWDSAYHLMKRMTPNWRQYMGYPAVFTPFRYSAADFSSRSSQRRWAGQMTFHDDPVQHVKQLPAWFVERHLRASA